jgi:hypothetical protein
MTNLVEHAKEELKRAGVEKEYADPIVDMVRIFSDMGHSGTSEEYVRGIVTDLLARNNLTPLTDDPSEWIHHGEEMWGEKGGIWQNIRNSRAFSRDGGKHYWLLEDRPNEAGIKKQYTSQKMKD